EIADQIRAADMRPDAVARLHADALRTEVHRLLEQRRREDPVADDLLLAVDVLDEMVERLHALLEAGLGARPLAAGDRARNHVEGPRAVDVAAFGVDREGHAHDLDR